ncbi:MAG: cytochrome C oxidase subunit IV family protein [Chitinophagaceae bacterium]
MENVHGTAELHQDDAHTFDTKAIWRTFRILLYITVFELILAIGYYKFFEGSENAHVVKHLLNGVFIILTLAKAFFIVAEFMHLGHEVRNLILTIAIPSLLFLWFIGAFLWDGSSYKNLRNRYDREHIEKSKEKAPEKKEEAKKPGSIE